MCIEHSFFSVLVPFTVYIKNIGLVCPVRFVTGVEMSGVQSHSHVHCIAASGLYRSFCRKNKMRTKNLMERILQTILSISFFSFIVPLHSNTPKQPANHLRICFSQRELILYFQPVSDCHLMTSCHRIKPLFFILLFPNADSSFLP